MPSYDDDLDFLCTCSVLFPDIPCRPGYALMVLLANCIRASRHSPQTGIDHFGPARWQC